MTDQFGAAERPKTVLVVEDEMPIRALMEIVLKRQGFRVVASSCGAEALNLFFENASSIDLLIADLSLPKIRGTELVERVREIRPDLPVIYASGSFRMESLISDHYVNGAIFLSKPFTIGELIEAVESIVTIAHGDRAGLAALGSEKGLLATGRAGS